LLKAKREEIGLTALAGMLSLDPPNLQKVFRGKRNLSASIMQKLRARPVNDDEVDSKVDFTIEQE
jgi:hypothetical protein